MTTNLRKFLIIALVSLGLFLFVNKTIVSYQGNQIDKLKQELSLSEASRDSLRSEYKVDQDTWEYSKKAYIADASTLKANLVKYSKELDSLRKARPKAESGFIADVRVETDTVWRTDTVYQDEQQRPVYQYSLKDQFQEGKATAYPDSLRLKLTTLTGLTAVLEDGQYKITPTNKNVKITGLEGFKVSQPVRKNKFWKGLGIGIGVGAVATGAIILAK